MNCIVCNKETQNPKYCSRSCSVTHTNKLFPKRKCKNTCKSCSTSIGPKKTYCDNCKPNKDHILKDIIYERHHKSSAFALVRSLARTVGKKLGFKACANCGYSKHIEICHIIPVSSFPETSRVSEINHSKNLIPLCPNCHWEFDHGKLSVHSTEFESVSKL